MASQPISPLLLRIPAVCAMVGLSRSQIYRLMKAGKFPASISLGTYSVAWSAEQVHAWVEEKICTSAR